MKVLFIFVFLATALSTIRLLELPHRIEVPLVGTINFVCGMAFGLLSRKGAL